MYVLMDVRMSVRLSACVHAWLIVWQEKYLHTGIFTVICARLPSFPFSWRPEQQYQWISMDRRNRRNVVFFGDLWWKVSQTFANHSNLGSYLPVAPATCHLFRPIRRGLQKPLLTQHLARPALGATADLEGCVPTSTYCTAGPTRI